MTDADKIRFAQVMQAIAENFGQTLTREGLRLRFAALAAYSIDDVERAALSLISERRYSTMPTVADFVHYLGGGSVEDRAEVQAAKVLDAISSVGGYRSVVFDDPVTQAVILHGFGGWSRMCAEHVEKDDRFWRKDFVRIYAAMSRQGVAVHGHLPGIEETTNLARGQERQGKICKIGNAEMCANIIAQAQAKAAIEA